MNELRLHEPNFQMAIEKEHYVKKECFINSILDFYGSSLFSEKERTINKS
jgi:hypothetical protein